MAQYSPTYIAELQRKHNLIYWKLYDRSKKLLIDSQESTTPLERSIEALQNTLENCTGDVVYLELYGDVPKKRTDGGPMPKTYEMFVRLDNSHAGAGRGAPAPGGQMFDQILALHNQIAEMRIEAVKKEMEAQIAGPPAPSVWEELVKQCTPYIPKLLDRMDKPQQVSAPPTPSRSGSAPSTNQLETISAKFEKVDPDYLNTLAKMAEYLEKNPGVLPNIKAIVGA